MIANAIATSTVGRGPSVNRPAPMAGRNVVHTLADSVSSWEWSPLWHGPVRPDSWAYVTGKQVAGAEPGPDACPDPLGLGIDLRVLVRAVDTFAHP